MLSSLLKQIDQDFQHIIWDWNGTLLADVDIVVEALCQQLQECGKKPISVAEHRKLFCFPIKDYYQSLGLEVSEDVFPSLAARYQEIYEGLVSQARLYDGVEEVLATLKDQGKKQYILSAAEQGHLSRIVDSYGISKYFDAICGLPNRLGQSKVEEGRKLLQHYSISPKEAVFIGDTDHDLAVGRRMGMPVILMAHGHQSYERLKSVHDNVVKIESKGFTS